MRSSGTASLIFLLAARLRPALSPATRRVAWQEDVHALDTLQSRGIQDILLWPDKPLPDIAVKSVQRLLDYLDAKGFHYGVSFGPGMTQMASGYVVKPSVYRKDVRPTFPTTRS